MSFKRGPNRFPEIHLTACILFFPNTQHTKYNQNTPNIRIYSGSVGVVELCRSRAGTELIEIHVTPVCGSTLLMQSDRIQSSC